MADRPDVRARELRVVLRPRNAGRPRRSTPQIASVADSVADSVAARVPAVISSAVTDVLGAGWTVRPLAAGSDLLLAVGPGPAPVGSPEHAQASHEAAYALQRSGRFAQVEADVPVWGYAAGEVADRPEGEVGPGLRDADVPLHWPREILRWSAALDLMHPAVRGGVGVVVGQPDTGYSVHPNLGLAGLDLDHDRDVIDGDDDAIDNLGRDPVYAWPFVGHGTSTASVVVGHGPPEVGIEGLLPAGTLVPIRATESVIQVFDSDVAQAVAWARQVGCHVITMSLGGKGLFGLHEEIQRAVDAGIIVMAAAGNYVGFVTAPASYDNCLAVAATGPNDHRWEGSSRGPAVDVAMPGQQVPVARWDLEGKAFVAPTDGTSFAVAHLAAAAGLWLAHHGRAALLDRYGAAGMQAAFLAALHQPGVCVRADDWDDGWGIGRVDLVGLLRADLPPIAAPALVAPPAVDAVVRISRALGRPEADVRAGLASVLRATDERDQHGALVEHDEHDLAELLRVHAGELVYLAYADPAFAAALAGSTVVPVRLEVQGVSGALADLLAS